jgi:trk system potassium uptake protein TrkH
MTALADQSRISRVLAAARVPQAIPALGFLAIILVGSALLAAPWSHQPGAVGYLDALFTSTSAVCVTGLTTVSTANDFTPLGQAIILLLIQIGGLGVMTYAAIAFTVLRRRMSLRTQAALHDSLFQADQARDFQRRFRQIISITFGIEALGMLALFLVLLPDFTTRTAAWQAIFHSISAFCNAGFSLLPNNLVDIRSNHVFMLVVMALIVLGGLGFIVLHEVFAEFKRVLLRRKRERPWRLSLHTNIVLRVSLILIVAGALGMLLLGLTPSEATWGERVEAAFFQSISARTCGFNSISIAALPLASLAVLGCLMFIGGSPASCAGGIKTTSFAVLLARARSYLTGQEDARLLGRRIPAEAKRAAALLLFLAVGWNLVGIFVLGWSERARTGIELQHLLFEQISAFGTVGLSADTTAGLTTVGKLWIVATMYVGRLGPLTLATLATLRRTPRVTYPEGKVMIG